MRRVLFLFLDGVGLGEDDPSINPLARDDYPVLHRLERQGHVAAKWAAAESGRKRKYYRITKEGRAQLAAQRQQWQAVDNTLRGIWMQACTV